jgi:Domain of unknown function (DUF1707)
MTDTASGGYPAGDLRASDADRDRVLAELSEHFQAGRLTVEELDERSGRALQARTGSDLAVLLADLPPGPSRAAASPPAPAPPVSAGPRQSGLPMARIAVLALVAAVAIAAVSGASHGHHSLAILAPVLIVVFIARRLAGGGWRR